MISRLIPVTASAAGNVTVTHNLGYYPTGWAIISPSHATAAFNAVVDSDTLNSKTSVTLIFSAAGSVNLLIW